MKDIKNVLEMLDKVIGAYLVEALSAETDKDKEHAEQKALSYMKLQKNLKK